MRTVLRGVPFVVLALAALAGSAAAQESEAEPTATVLLHVPSPADAAERAYEAALPFLAGQPALSVLPLTSLLPDADSDARVGFEGGDCVALSEATFEELVARADDETTMVELTAAGATLQEAERVLACGEASPELAGDLASARALVAWMDDDRDGAAVAWRELYALQPGRSSDPEIPPDAQAAQLAAKTEVGRALAKGAIRWLVPEGWSAWVDGQPVAAGRTTELPGRRLVRLDGAGGERLGGVVRVDAGRTTLVGTRGMIDVALDAGGLDEAMVGWLAGMVAPAVEREGAAAALLVDLGTEPATVWRLAQGGFLLMTVPQVDPETGLSPRQERALARGQLVAGFVMAGGLAATLLGTVIALGAHSDGAEMDMESVEGFDSNYEAYNAARELERVGVGLAIGGGVAIAGGAVTFVIPAARKRAGQGAEP